MKPPMSNAGPQTVIYQADPEMVAKIKSAGDHLRHSCKPYMNRRVRVQTLEGHVHEGVITGIDGKHLYLSVTVAADTARGLYNPYYNPYNPYPGSAYYNNVVLPLVLYELLVISLL